MRIHRVAIDAIGKSQLLFEIASRVATCAANLQMAAGQRVLCFGVVKLHGKIDFFPARGRVAGFARAFERSLVRIGVAICARPEFYAAIFHRFFRLGREVALFACHLGVHSGQRIFGFRVVELLGLFPIRDVMAALAIVAELAFVHVFMASRALLRKAHEGRGKIFLLDQSARRRGHVRRSVALLARHVGVLFNQRISGEAVIELFLRRVPMHQRKILAVMFQVAAHAILAVGIRHGQLRVVALVRR